MADHCEEQELEAEALTAIFDNCLEIVSSTQPFEWAISLWPEQHSSTEENETNNHVGIKLIVKVPSDYPEISLPELSVEILKGLTHEHQDQLLQMAKEEAEANLGQPSVYAICERLREWLAENNVKGMDDLSMYAQMMRREKVAQKEAEKAQLEFEAQKQKEELTQAEAEDLAIRKRRAEGTPVNDETFKIWKEKFEEELAQQREKDEKAAGNDLKKRKEKVVDKTGRLTGFAQFSGKLGAMMNWEAMEAACENAQRDEDEEDEDNNNNLDNVNEDLFDVDDEDLDDLDFDDDEEDEPDI